MREEHVRVLLRINISKICTLCSGEHLPHNERALALAFILETKLRYCFWFSHTLRPWERDENMAALFLSFTDEPHSIIQS